VSDFLLEIGSEEIPDWMIRPALESLRLSFSEQAGALSGTIELLEATPRRLVLLATGLAEQLADVQQVVPGPYVTAGSKAAEGFAKKNNTTVDRLQKDADAKGERYFFSMLKKGESARELLTRVVPGMITGIPWPKAMYWTGKDGVRFIRPIRWLLAILNDEVLPIELALVKAGNTTRGHRILGSKTPLVVSAATYESTLRDNHVIVRAKDRRKRIQDALAPDVDADGALLETLVYLTEWPTPIRGSFDPGYLELPREILSTVMRHHQRYFSVLQPNGTLAPAFVAVTNTDGDPDGLIRRGNERVLRARFNDARFFWQVDQRKPLSDRVDDLANVTFQAKLGSYKDKTERVVKLAVNLAGVVGADIKVVERAAFLAKCDLTTDMVKEFTELQGVVGGLYAQIQGEGEAVATAIYDHYKPVGMEDGVPRTLEAQIVALADKLDTLRECFKIGLIPTSSKDPFGLRRAAQGVIKILFEAKLPLQFASLSDGSAQLAEFLRERIHYYLREIRGYAYDEVNAVLVPPVGTLNDLEERAKAVHEVRPTADFEPLAASFKRIKNILKQAQSEHPGAVDPSLLSSGPEEELHDAFVRVRESTKANLTYDDKLVAIASLRPQIDLFFDKILVNDSDPAIRQNRLALLHSLLTEFSTIADFSEIVTQGA
jgi:glycyl-tRNA synthetase beta chain